MAFNSSTKPSSPPAEAQATPAARSRAVAIAAVVTAVFITACWGVWQVTRPTPPPPDADPVTLARFLATGRYESLLEAQKRPYMKAARRQQAAIADARRDGRLTEDQYTAARVNAYLERKLDHMSEYFALPAAQRNVALLREYAHKPLAAKGAASKPAAPDAAQKSDESDQDELVAARVASWPAEQQAKWEEYRQAVKRTKETVKRMGTGPPPAR